MWPNYELENATHQHLMSIVFMVNEKFRERVEVWSTFEQRPEEFAGLFRNILKKCLDNEGCQMREKTALLIFLNHCFTSMEVELCRNQVKRLVSLSMWSCLQPSNFVLSFLCLSLTNCIFILERLEQELREIPEWKKYWKKLQKKDEKGKRNPEIEWERHFLQNLIVKFLEVLESIPLEGFLNESVIHYCERFLEFIIDLEALLPTRRFFNTVLDDSHLLVRAQICNLVQRPEGKLFGQVSNDNF